MDTLLSSSPVAIAPPRCPDLLAPAGNWDCARAAVENGADAIYFGLDRFNARMRAQNFTEADLPELMAFLHRRGVKGYVTLNTLVFPAELAEAEQYVRTMIAAGVDAAIVQDIGICRLIRHLSPDFPIHASTQMTITSAAGVAFAQALGCNLVVLARECSLKDIRKIRQQLGDSLRDRGANRAMSMPLEVFVHGALCVAYSGQCLTSESLGGRSANRGECAQACRMPYDLIADGQKVDLGDRHYLLSPQDLSGLDVLPDLVATGVACLKIEGRLKSPEYVANVTRVYRNALDRVWQMVSERQSDEFAARPSASSPEDRYNLEMAFSRGLYTGWFRGINNQELVHARFGKKRGVYLGEVTRLRNERAMIRLQAPLKPGDGVVFDSGHPDAPEEGGRVYSVEMQGNEATLTFGRGAIDWRRVRVGDRLWKTSDPELDRQLRQSYAGDTPKVQRPIAIEVHGEAGQPLVAIARDEQGHIAQIESELPLAIAQTQPLTTERLRAQLGRLGNTPFYLDSLQNHLGNATMLPLSELNRLRRELVAQLEAQRAQPKPWHLNPHATLHTLLPAAPAPSCSPASTNLIALTRTLPQLQAALTAGLRTLYCEFEDPRKYREAVGLVRSHPNSDSLEIFVAPPRITKPSETWILRQVKNAQADGYLVRNYDHLQFFADQRRIGDFSLNVANALSADYFQRAGLERLTASYDLNLQQLEGLLTSCPPDWFEVTIHQHMPMFHMEHCVFCAFLSQGTDYTNCGRPCEKQVVKLRDRTGTEHILQADAGCRNTVFNGTAQTGAEAVHRLMQLGAQAFRLEFLNETPAQVMQTIQRYQALLEGTLSGTALWKDLKLQNQLGVTRGTLNS
ncbi:U32 family peptidase [Thermoleptolyngbya sp. PKUAC-SCTB121]|uniref:U32 family peptidase n=1 Tax=Thermoleptolyngbya sp. PKUAC-SCTB121 TaxID=2811482 RepID=UPI0019637004|nr:U32 family peptidase [Thermoleptolyngbya sp. PKUAC-SCTB121]